MAQITSYLHQSNSATVLFQQDIHDITTGEID